MSSVSTDNPSLKSTSVSHGPDGRSPCLAVVEGISDLAGVEPHALAGETGIVLHDHVDSDALNTLVACTDGCVSISFDIEGYEVSVTDDEVVVQTAT